MKAFLITFGILFLVGLSTQLLRHVYVQWVAPKSSVLDQYEEKTDKDIAASKTLEELVQQYDVAHRQFKEWKQGKTPEQQEKEAHLQESHKSLEKLRRAIMLSEQRIQELSALHCYWWSGLACVIVGLCLFRAHHWLGLGVLLVGFVEMLYWTSPTFGIGGGTMEFERLVFWKIVYTSVSLAILLALWACFVCLAKRPVERPQA